ncbi:mavicyanin-like [Phoenix dactylifera]|uniref:Mavicyanin-like n=1 Tax=Phoenix dactylifera TaxID=42345 RepID=A0A8B7BJA1_PHODC|nr:mavicyanin-like [Phoenix dactylifera]
MAGYTSIALGALLLLSCAAWGSATVYTVGGSSGWNTGINYTDWTSGKTFTVGDSLLFNYATGAHTVTEVNSGDYDSCSSSNAISSETNGPTTIQLKTTGTRYYICSISGHCGLGMKVAVTVGSSGSPSTPPPPSTSTPSPPSSTTNGNHSSAPGLAPASAVASLAGLVVLLF